MRNISDENLIKVTFIFSLLAHTLFLGMPGFNLTKPQTKKDEEINVRIEIEKPPLLPKIDVMGEEKKLKEIVKKKKPPEPESEPESKSQPQKEEIEKETKPQEQIQQDFKLQEEKEESPKNTSQENIKVINPQDEAMLRYQDMVKQKIESCRRYPSWAKKQGFEGSVYLAFTLLSDGNARDIEIVQSSGFDILDNEALSTVKRASPFLPIPKEFNCSRLKMEVAVVFRLK